MFRLKAEGTSVRAIDPIRAIHPTPIRLIRVYFQRTLSSNDTLIFASGPGVTGIGLPSFW